MLNYDLYGIRFFPIHIIRSVNCNVSVEKLFGLIFEDSLPRQFDL